MTRKRNKLWVTVVLDALLINIAFVLSYIVRYQLDIPSPVDPLYYATYEPYIPYAALLTVLSLLMFWLDGLYSYRRRKRVLGQLYRIINGTTTSIVIIMAITFFVQPLVYSRGMLVLAGIINVSFLSLIRSIGLLILTRQFKRGLGIERVLVVGAGEVGRTVMRTILADNLLGMKVVGYLDDDPSKGNGLGRIKSLGGLDSLAQAIKDEDVSEVIITLPWMYHRRILQFVEQCERYDVHVRIVPDVLQRSMKQVDLENLNGIPLMAPADTQMLGTALRIKRIIDLAISFIALPGFLFITAIVAVLIRLDSKGPVFFRQERVGRDGQPFMVYKYRTMVEGADKLKDEVAHLSKYQGDTLLKIPEDPRMTRVGRLLRRASIDELPQLINVLRGEMSWVGPRPNTPDEVEKYEIWQRKRLATLPGISGLWQVSGRSDIPFDEMCLLDIFYIENWSLGLDIRILLQTIPRVIFGSGAY